MAGMCAGGRPRALSQLPPNLTPQPQARSDPSALPVRSSQSFLLVLSCPLKHRTQHQPVMVSSGGSLTDSLRHL